MTSEGRSGPQIDAFEAQFGRGQAEWALWRCVTDRFERKPSSIFRVRIKHLLEFDRNEPPLELRRRKIWAFADETPRGQGDHALFSAYDVLFLYIGLRLVDLGFKRKEVVLLLRGLRPRLREDLGPFLAEHAHKPIEEFEPLAPDNLVALVLPRVEEAADYAEAGDGDVCVCRGRDQILEKIAELFPHNLVILQVGAAAYRLGALLLRAPLPRRSRR